MQSIRPIHLDVSVWPWRTLYLRLTIVAILIQWDANGWARYSAGLVLSSSLQLQGLPLSTKSKLRMLSSRENLGYRSSWRHTIIIKHIFCTWCSRLRSRSLTYTLFLMDVKTFLERKTHFQLYFHEKNNDKIKNKLNYKKQRLS